MRLQLTVQRHGLPPAYVLWTLASAVRPPLLAAGNGITISQFLEQVNEVIPLESEDWGLEDYSVEVRGFECLHFCELNQVLKEDDEVCIRPLQTQDLRFRRVSGRHQISADGKHLIDGVAFGRPFLRLSDRPAIRIPPRKRRRILYDDEDYHSYEEPNQDQQIVIGAGFDDADEGTAGDESDGEDDFAADDEEEDDLGAELEDLQNELNGGADAAEGASQYDDQRQRTTRSRRSPKGLGLLQLLDENGRPFAGQYSNPLLDLYRHDDPPSSQPKIRVRKRDTADLIQKPSKSIRSILRDSSASPQRVGRPDSAGSNRSVRFENAEPATPATIRESEGSEDPEDGDFELGEVDESDKENAEPQVEETESSDSFFEGSQSSSSTSSDNQLAGDETSSSGSSFSGSSSSESSSSGSSTSESSSNAEPEEKPNKDVLQHQSGISETSETSSSGPSSSSSSSDFEGTSPKTGQKRKWAVLNVTSKTLAGEVLPGITTPASAITPSGKGRSQTHSRNKRRKESKRLSFMKSKGILRATATKADLHKFDEETTQPERQEMIAVGGVRDIFEAKKQDLLASIAAGGVDVRIDPCLQERNTGATEDNLTRDNPTSKAAATEHTMKTDRPASVTASGKVEAGKPSANDRISTSTDPDAQDLRVTSPTKAKESTRTDSINTTTTAIVPDSIITPPLKAKETSMDHADSTPAAVEVADSKTTPAPDSQHRRSRLDMSGAKRMLFGSLGLRTPKTKDDETKTREKLMKDVRPIKEPRFNEDIDSVEDVAAAAEDESWKDKIDLRAVECCQEGIELSMPPFPFVQRWDPQQQRGYNMGNARKRKGKKRKRNNNDYYEDSYFHPQDKEARRNNQRYSEGISYNLQNKVVDLNEEDGPGQEAEWKPATGRANAESKDQELSHDETFEDSIKANKQLLHETEDASADTLVEMEQTDNLASDLPTLPEDLSAFPSLTIDTAANGSIVAFKQLEMSAVTNWQPKISGYRTAIVDAILDDGTLSMTLAKRDQSSRDVHFDEQTGERLYSKFEMPGYHDGNGENNTGKVEISFDELINPVLVDATGKTGSQVDLLQAQDHAVVHMDPVERAVTEEAHDTDVDPQGVSLDGQTRGLSNEEAAEPSEEARQDISELIRDAGWRSSVANHELIERQLEGTPAQNDDPDEPVLVDPISPKFYGFSSSPLPNEFQVASSSPPLAALQTARHVHASGFEIAESVPPQDPDDSPARSMISNHRSVIDYPNLPQGGDDSDLVEQEAQDRSGFPEADHQIASQDLNSPSSVRQSSSQGFGSPTLTSPEKSSLRVANVLDGADSDESLPELFSQAFEKRLSQGRDIKEDAITPLRHRKSKRNSRISSSQRESNRDWEPGCLEEEVEDENASTPRPTQSVFSSQVVDLTISSDSVDPPDDSYNDDESYVLPKGPGWVHKSKTSMSRVGPTKKTTTRGSTRSR